MATMTKTQLDGTKKNDTFEVKAGTDTLITAGKGSDTLVLPKDASSVTYSIGESIGTGKYDALYITYKSNSSATEADSRVIVENYFTLDKSGNVTGTKSSMKNITIDGKTTLLVDSLDMAKLNSTFSYEADKKGNVKGSVFSDVVTSTEAKETFNLGTGKDTINFSGNFGADTVVANANEEVNLKFEENSAQTYSISGKNLNIESTTSYDLYKTTSQSGTTYSIANNQATGATKVTALYTDDAGALTESKTTENKEITNVYLQDGKLEVSKTYTGTAVDAKKGDVYTYTDSKTSKPVYVQNANYVVAGNNEYSYFTKTGSTEDKYIDTSSATAKEGYAKGSAVTQGTVIDKETKGDDTTYTEMSGYSKATAGTGNAFYTDGETIFEHATTNTKITKLASITTTVDKKSVTTYITDSSLAQAKKDVYLDSSKKDVTSSVSSHLDKGSIYTLSNEVYAAVKNTESDTYSAAGENEYYKNTSTVITKADYDKLTDKTDYSAVTAGTVIKATTNDGTVTYTEAGSDYHAAEDIIYLSSDSKKVDVASIIEKGNVYTVNESVYTEYEGYSIVDTTSDKGYKYFNQKSGELSTDATHSNDVYDLSKKTVYVTEAGMLTKDNNVVTAQVYKNSSDKYTDTVTTAASKIYLSSSSKAVAVASEIAAGTIINTNEGVITAADTKVYSVAKANEYYSKDSSVITKADYAKLSDSDQKSYSAVEAGKIIKTSTDTTAKTTTYAIAETTYSVTDAVIYLDKDSKAITTVNSTIAKGGFYTTTGTGNDTVYTVWEKVAATEGKSFYKAADGTITEEATYAYNHTDGGSVVVKNYLTGKYDVTVGGKDLMDAASINEVVMATTEGGTEVLADGVKYNKKKDTYTYKGSVLDKKITGTDSTDIIYANAQDTTLVGGEGDDMLYGGAGKNTYAYNKELFGDDTIVAKGANNKIDLSALGTAGTNYDVDYVKVGNNVVAEITGTAETVSNVYSAKVDKETVYKTTDDLTKANSAIYLDKEGKKVDSSVEGGTTIAQNGYYTVDANGVYTVWTEATAATDSNFYKGVDGTIFESEDGEFEYGSINLKNYLKGTKVGKADVQIGDNDLTTVLTSDKWLLQGNDETAKAQSLKGTIYNDAFVGGDGNDKMFGYDGDDVFLGGLGNDTINTGEGKDYILLSNEDYETYDKKGKLIVDEKGAAVTQKDYSVDTVVRGTKYGSEQHIEFVNPTDDFDADDIKTYLDNPSKERRDVSLNFTRKGNDVTITDLNFGDGNGNYQGVTIKNFNKIGNRSDLYINGDTLTSYADASDNGNMRYKLGYDLYGTQVDDTFTIDGANTAKLESLNGGAGNDTYNVGSNATTTKDGATTNSDLFDLTKQSLVITDTEGTDTLNLYADNALSIFNVTVTDKTKKTGTVGELMAVIDKSADSAADYKLGVHTSGVDSLSINGTSTTQTDTITQAVASWLSGTSYASSADFFANETNDTNIANLIKVYAGDASATAYNKA